MGFELPARERGVRAAVTVKDSGKIRHRQGKGAQAGGRELAVARDRA
jgi:hypothetical protein